MQDASLTRPNFNAQTQRLRHTVQQGTSLTTRRAERLGQIFLCGGCCCGRADKGFPPLPKATMKESWKSLKLNGTIQLTISGCLGPCDVANVVYLLASDGTIWLGGPDDGGAERAWLVLDRSGLSIGRFELPMTSRIVYAEDATCWIVELGAFDIPYVVQHSVAGTDVPEIRG